MKQLLWLVTVFIFAGILFVACQQAAQPTPTPVPKIATPTLRLAWEEKWESLLKEAKKEGALSLYTMWAVEIRNSLTKSFKEKHGIDLEFSTFSKGADALAKVKAERQAGLNIADVFGFGAPTLVGTMKPEGILRPVEPLLVLPEVMDSKLWSGGKLPFLDKDKLALGMIATAQRYIMYNTDLIKEGEITTYKDLLKPQYKGKIVFIDPTVTGSGNGFISHLAHDIWNLEELSNFLKQLIKQQDVVILRDNRLHVEWVARGKYAIGLAPDPDKAAEFLRLGAPLGFAINKEGVNISSSAGALAISNTPSHPNATAVFVNWLLTKEGQTAFSQSFGSPSARTDVSTGFFLPIYLAQPGEKLYIDDEEAILYKGKMPEITKKIIEGATK